MNEIQFFKNKRDSRKLWILIKNFVEKCDISICRINSFISDLNGSKVFTVFWFFD